MSIHIQIYIEQQYNSVQRPSVALLPPATARPLALAAFMYLACQPDRHETTRFGAVTQRQLQETHDEGVLLKEHVKCMG